MEANGLKCIFDLLSSVDAYASQTHQYTLRLSESLRDCEEKSPNKPPFAINFLEHSNALETFTSWIIRHIFAYTYNGRHPFFESFANTFLRKLGFKTDWIETPVIDKDHEYKNIDILVREDKRYAIIIENKLKGAPFQPNQLARYIAKMSNEGYLYEQIFVVVLPETIVNDLPASTWNLPKDWKSPDSKRKCRIAQYYCWCDYDYYEPKRHCAYCCQLKELFHNRTIFIYKEFSEWLYDCVVNNLINLPKEELRKQYVLTSAVLQFVDFLNSIYQTRENNKYKMDIQNFLSEQLKLSELNTEDQLSLLENRQKDVEELEKRLQELFDSKCTEYITTMCAKHRVHLKFDDNDGLYFHCNLNFSGTSVSVMVAKDKEGDYCQIETKQRRKIPEIIRNDFDIYEELNDKENRNDCIWKYDSYKESLLRFDRVLGKLLELSSRE